MALLASVLALNTQHPTFARLRRWRCRGKPTGSLPIQVSESLTYENGVTVGSMDYVMSLAQAGWIHYGFLGGAPKLSQYGNLNTNSHWGLGKPKEDFRFRRGSGPRFTVRKDDYFDEARQ